MGKGSTKSDGPADTVEAWTEKDQRIVVAEGSDWGLALRAKVDSSPDAIYDILTDPNTVSIFRSIKECTYRRIVEDDGKGRRKLEIGHRALAKFLFLSVSFETHLHVWEDSVEKTIRFEMAKPGIMQKFDGCWRIKPFTQRTLDEMYHPDDVKAKLQGPEHGLFNAHNLFSFLQPKPPAATESLVTLEQNILPRGPVPPGVKGLVRGMCAHQIRCMMEDLRKELQRRKDGTSAIVNGRQGNSHDKDKQSCCKGSGSGKEGSAAPAAAKAACLTLAQPSLWRVAAPLEIVVAL